MRRQNHKIVRSGHVKIIRRTGIRMGCRMLTQTQSRRCVALTMTNVAIMIIKGTIVTYAIAARELPLSRRWETETWERRLEPVTHILNMGEGKRSAAWPPLILSATWQRAFDQ